MAGVDLVELQNKVLTLEKSFAELAKWTKFHFNFNPQQKGFENIENSPNPPNSPSPASEPTSPPVPVANVAASENVGESTGNIGNRRKRDLGEIRVVCKDEPMDENEDDGINNPQGTSACGTQVAAPNPDTVSTGSVVEQGSTKDNGVEDEEDFNSSISNVSSENGKTAGNKNKSPKKESPTATKSSTSTSCRKSPFVSVKRLSPAQILSIKKKMVVKSKPQWKCPHCPKILPWKSALTDHISSHADDRPFRCPHCPTATKQIGTLRRHIRKVHPKENQNLLPCKICQNKFKSQKILHKHMKKHLDCYFCSRRVENFKSMRHHLTIHTGEKPFSCPHCQHSTAREGHLKEHIQRRHPKKYRVIF